MIVGNIDLLGMQRYSGIQIFAYFSSNVYIDLDSLSSWYMLAYPPFKVYIETLTICILWNSMMDYCHSAIQGSVCIILY